MEFKKEDAEALLAPCGLEGDYEVHAEGGDRQAGVWPAVKFDRMMEVETNVMRWRPAQVFADDPDPPDVARTPSLPFPFTERQLAAFMLDGVGLLVAGRYGDWGAALYPSVRISAHRGRHFRLMVDGVST